MARNQKWILEGLLVLTVTALLTRPAEAANCAADDDCENSGTCPDPNNAPCDCSASDYKGDTCEDACLSNDDCLNEGTCDTSGINNVCSCKDDYKGLICADDCEKDEDCGTGGTCATDSPRKCSCADEKKEGPGCSKDKSGASAAKSFSLMSLFVILTGYLL